MGLLNKMRLHVADKYIATQMQGMKMGDDITQDSNKLVKLFGFVGGTVVGSAVGMVRVWNPLDIADSFLTLEEDMEKRIDEKFESSKLDYD